MTAPKTPWAGEHRRVFLAIVPPVAALTLLTAPGEAMQIALVAVAVALVGIPHGALDLDVANTLWPLSGRRRIAAFVAGYLGLALAVLALWLVAPGLALAAFLAYSALHFGTDWAGDVAPPARAVLGAGVVSLPAVLYGDAVAGLFAALAPAQSAVFLAETLGWIGLATLALLPPLWWRTGGAEPGALAEIAAVLAMALVLPPLAYFALYFGALHAPRHLIETAARLGTTPRRAASRSIRLTLLTLGAMAVAGGTLLGQGVQPDETAVSVIFIALAALTVPHMALTALMHRRGCAEATTATRPRRSPCLPRDDLP